VGQVEGTSRTPPLPYRVRPSQVLLGVGAVLLVSAGAAIASAYGGGWARALLLLLAGVAAGCAVSAARARLRSSAETLGAAATGLALAAAAPAGLSLDGEPVTAAVLAGVFVALHLVDRRTAVWPLAAWGAGQLAVLRTLDDLPGALHTQVHLLVALVGLGIALFGRPVVGRAALVTAAPWWLAGVVAGTSSAWTDTGILPWLSALFVVGAAAGLLPARLRRPLDPLLGPPRAIPVVAGVVAGAAVTGPFSMLDPVVVAVVGFGGVLLATLPPAVLTGWPRGMFVPMALAAGVVVSGLSLVQLAAAGRWAALSLLLLLTALPTVLVAARRPEERPVALPTVVGCLAGAVLLALPDQILAPSVAATLLTVLYAVAMSVGATLDPTSRTATARAAALTAGAALVLLAVESDRPVLAAGLAVQGAFTLTWAWRTRVSTTTWRIGAAQLVAAVWVFAAAQDASAVEWFTLSAAAGLLVASGRRLRSGPSWPTWGPGLLVAVVPTAALAVVGPDAGRTVAVLAAAALLMVTGARTGLRAPLLVGALTALWTAVGFAVRALPWPLATALVVGALLLAVGMARERRPVAGFGARLADLR
jgi:hypothetical protein